MFVRNEKVVYPGHGVARVVRVVERQVGGQIAHFYELKFVNKDMTVLVPVDSADAVGVRVLSSPNSIDLVFSVLSEPKVTQTCHDRVLGSWNRRSKRYQRLLRTGDLVEIARIYRDLQLAGQHKGLSFGERTLLAQTETLLAEEIALVYNQVVEQAIARLRETFGQACAPVAAGSRGVTRPIL